MRNFNKQKLEIIYQQVKVTGFPSYIIWLILLSMKMIKIIFNDIFDYYLVSNGTGSGVFTANSIFPVDSDTFYAFCAEDRLTNRRS